MQRRFRMALPLYANDIIIDSETSDTPMLLVEEISSLNWVKYTNKKTMMSEMEQIIDTQRHLITYFLNFILLCRDFLLRSVTVLFDFGRSLKSLKPIPVIAEEILWRAAFVSDTSALRMFWLVVGVDSSFRNITSSNDCDRFGAEENIDLSLPDISCNSWCDSLPAVFMLVLRSSFLQYPFTVFPGTEDNRKKLGLVDVFLVGVECVLAIGLEFLDDFPRYRSWWVFRVGLLRRCLKIGYPNRNCKDIWNETESEKHC